MCRKTHGSAFSAYATAKKADFRWVAGEELVTNYESSPQNYRCFCNRCGSPLVGLFASDPNSIGIVLGALDDDPGVRPIAHIFVRSKAPWYEITDQLMQFDEWPPGMEPGGAK
jgi:hypothetical protein